MSGYMGSYPHLERYRADRWCNHLRYWPAGDDGPEEYGCKKKHNVDDEFGCSDCEDYDHVQTRFDAQAIRMGLREA